MMICITYNDVMGEDTPSFPMGAFERGHSRGVILAGEMTHVQRWA